MKGVDTAAHKNYIAALIRKIKNPQELVEIGTGRSKKTVEVDDADEGVKYARAAIEYEEVRGASAQQLLDAADGDHPQGTGMHSIMHQSEKKSWTGSMLNKRGLNLLKMINKLRTVLYVRVQKYATDLKSAPAIASKSGRRHVIICA